MAPRPAEPRTPRGGPTVLMTTDAVGGVWTYSLELCAALAPHGVKVALCTMGPAPTAEQREEAGEIAGVELFESCYRLEWMDDPWGEVERAGQWLLEVAAGVGPDLVHLNGYAHGHLPFGVPVLVVAHSCVLSWWEAVKRAPLPSRYARYREEVARGLGAARSVVAPTAAMLEAVVRHYGRPSRSRVIHNARERLRFSPAAKKAPFILAAGRLWDEAKNVAALAKVAPRLAWPVRVAGDSSPPAGRKEPPSGVQALGRLHPAALAEQLGQASIFAHPARYEPFGLGVLEAAQSGCALVLGDLPSLREVWADAALYVHPEDPHALGEALGALIERPDRLRELGGLARERSGLYRAQRMARAYLDEYSTLLAEALPA